MESITIRIPESVLESLDEEADEHGVSRSEYVRGLIEKGREYDELKADRDRLERQLGQLVEQREEHQELVRYVEDELSYREQGLTTRLRWWLFGKGES